MSLNDNAPILLLVTGGTLDKDYHPLTGELTFSDSHLEEMLTEANITHPLQLNVLMLKDSLDMTLDDREAIARTCIDSSASQIIITHGTDTMTLTAEFLANLPELELKTIVLTGAMRPFKLGHSDASFNLGAAIMAVKLSPPSVYIVMNGQRFAANSVSKNRTLGVFQPAD